MMQHIRGALKVMLPIYFHKNCNRKREHSNTVEWNKFTYVFLSTMNKSLRLVLVKTRTSEGDPLVQSIVDNVVVVRKNVVHAGAFHFVG